MGLWRPPSSTPLSPDQSWMGSTSTVSTNRGPKPIYLSSIYYIYVTLCTIPIWDLSSAPFKLNQTDLKGSFTDLQEDGEGRELYTSEVNIELVSHYLAVSEATPLVEAAQTGQDLDIRSEDGLVIIVHKSINDHKWAINLTFPPSVSSSRPSRGQTTGTWCGTS